MLLRAVTFISGRDGVFCVVTHWLGVRRSSGTSDTGVILKNPYLFSSCTANWGENHYEHFNNLHPGNLPDHKER